jgi:hypothetical protein
LFVCIFGYFSLLFHSFNSFFSGGKISIIFYFFCQFWRGFSMLKSDFREKAEHIFDGDFELRGSAAAASQRRRLPAAAPVAELDQLLPAFHLPQQFFLNKKKIKK